MEDKLEEELEQYVLSYARECNIPNELLSAVVERVRAATDAVDHFEGYAPLFERWAKEKPTNLVVVNGLEDLEKEIAAYSRLLARKVIDGAARDYSKGILERRCE